MRFTLQSREKINYIIWITAILTWIFVPILYILYFPTIVLIPLDIEYYLYYSIGTGISIFIAYFIWRIAHKSAEKKLLKISGRNTQFKITFYFIGIISILLGVGASSYLIYEKVDIALNSYNPSGVYITTPKIGAPIFQEPGTEFTCILGEGKFNENIDIDAYLLRGMENITLETEMIDSVTVNLTIPSNSPSGLFSLYLCFGDSIINESYAVRVWNSSERDINEPFRVAHITDTHISPGEYDSGTNNLKYNLQKLIDTLALMNPDLVLLTGDLTDDGELVDYEGLQELITQFGIYGIPIFMVLGNHDIKKIQYNNLEFWARNFAPFHYFRDIPNENIRFIIFNTGTRDEGFNLSNEIPFITQSLNSMSIGQESILVCHIPPYRYCDWAANKYQERQFNDLCDEYDVHAVITGHSHVDRVIGRRNIDAEEDWSEPSTDYPELTVPFSETAYIETIGKFNGPAYRWINFNDGDISNCTYDADGDGNLDQKSSILIKGLDFGSVWMEEQLSGNWTAYINNSLNMDLWDAQLSVLLPDVSDIENVIIDSNETSEDFGQRWISGNIAEKWETSIGLRIEISLNIAKNSIANVSFAFDVIT